MLWFGSHNFQTFQGILLKRIWGGWFLPIFFFASQIEQIKGLSTQYSLAMVHGATTDSKQQDHSAWLEKAKLHQKLTLPLSEVCVHLDGCSCAWRDHRLTSDVLVSHSPPLFLREGLSLKLEFIELVEWLTSDPQFLLYPQRVKYDLAYRCVPQAIDLHSGPHAYVTAVYRLKHLLAPECIVISGSF